MGLFDSKLKNMANALTPGDNKSQQSPVKNKKHPFDPIDMSGQPSARKAASYQLVLVEEGADGTYSIFTGDSGKKDIEFESTEYPYLYKAVLQDKNNPSIFEFPITPQLLNISTPYAIETLASSNGVVEEHAGVYFKIFSLAGTFGVNPGRKTFSTQSLSRKADNSALGLASSLFSNTLRSARNLVSQTRSFLSSLPFGLDKKTKAPQTKDLAPQDFGTGYYYAQALDRFLENYSIKKSQSYNYKKLKLALHIPKFGHAYLVTPMQYTYSQSAESPLEYRFSLQLKAYKRIVLGAKEKRNPLNKITQSELNNLQKIFVALNRGRMALSAVYDVVRSVRTDVVAPFEALRQSVLLVKGLLAAPLTLADIPVDIKGVIKLIQSDIKDIGDLLEKYKNVIQIDVAAIGAAAAGAITLFSKTGEGGGFDEESSISPNQILEILEEFTIEEYDASEQEIAAIENDIENLSFTTSDTIQSWIDILEDTAFLLANYYGAGDSTVSSIYNLPSPLERLQPLSIEEYLTLQAIYEAITALYILKSSNFITKNDNKAFEYVGELAEGTSYEFQSQKDALAIKVPVPYGLTIEQIAQKYLGDYNRWVEIATLNNLNSPYIDEVGFFRPFLSNGSGRRFNVSNGQDLYVGQKIWLFSDTVPKQQRTILAIDKLSDVDYLITVDGLDNLDIFTTTDNAKMHAFLPHTTNSSQTIWIPTNKVSDELVVFSPSEVAKLDKYTGVSKVDWALNDNGDIAIDSFGDIKLSYGLKNLYQSLRLKIISPEGSRLVDQEYGMGITPGTPLGELSIGNILKKFRSMIEADDRYDSIDNVEIDLSGPVMKINAVVSLRDGSGSIPISVAINEM